MDRLPKIIPVNVLTMIGLKMNDASNQKSKPTTTAMSAKPMPCINVISIQFPPNL